MKRDDIVALVLIILIILIILVILLLRSSIDSKDSDFGTWTTTQSSCLNNNQGCGVGGTREILRTCTPNPTTGFGCIGSDGQQTFISETSSEECFTTCFVSDWDNETSSTCQVYSDSAGTILAPSQSCRNNNPTEYLFQTVSRTCLPADTTGPNNCVRQDGSLANVGDIEMFQRPCAGVPECYIGKWEACGAAYVTARGFTGPASDCGRLVSSAAPPRCIIPISTLSGVTFQESPNPTSDCNPLDNTFGTCPVQILNFSCLNNPVGYNATIASHLGNGVDEKYFEISTTQGLTLEANYTSAQLASASSFNTALTGPVNTHFVSTTGNMGVRFRVIPSQAHAANGGFYLAASLPLNGEDAEVIWGGSNIQLVPIRIPNLGDTFDDLAPPPQLFTMTTTPFMINLFTAPSTTGAGIYTCPGSTNCLQTKFCTRPVLDPPGESQDVCV